MMTHTHLSYLTKDDDKMTKHIISRNETNKRVWMSSFIYSLV